LHSFFFPDDVGNRFWAAWICLGRKNLRFTVEGLKCCLGVKRKENGRKAARFLLRGIVLTWAAKPSVSQSL
jgi:hypothetical protein